MQKSAVYSVPLRHDNTSEYLRIRRDLERVGGSKTGAVAYDFPDNDYSRVFFRNIIGKSGGGLEPFIESLLRESGISGSFFENTLCNMVELDRAKRIGLIEDVYPIGIDRSSAQTSAVAKSFVDIETVERAWKARGEKIVMKGYPFDKVVLTVKMQLIAHYTLMRVTDAEMAKQVEALLLIEDKIPILMAGATHMPGIRAVLDHDNVGLVELEDPKAVSGMGWLLYNAMDEAKRLEGSSQVGMNLNKYALLSAINTLRTKKVRSTITKEEMEKIRLVETPEDANQRYLEAQYYYDKEFSPAYRQFVEEQDYYRMGFDNAGAQLLEAKNDFVKGFGGAIPILRPD